MEAERKPPDCLGSEEAKSEKDDAEVVVLGSVVLYMAEVDRWLPEVRRGAEVERSLLALSLPYTDQVGAIGEPGGSGDSSADKSVVSDAGCRSCRRVYGG